MGNRSPDLLRPRKSRFHNTESSIINSKKEYRKEESPEAKVNIAAPQLSKEERLQNLVSIYWLNNNDVKKCRNIK